jgi:hypothetical protein
VKTFQTYKYIYIHVPLVHPDKTLQLFQFVPFPVSKTLRPNSSMIPKLDKDFIAVGKTHQFLTKTLQEIQSCEKYSTTYLCQGSRQQERTSQDTCLVHFIWKDLLSQNCVGLN